MLARAREDNNYLNRFYTKHFVMQSLVLVLRVMGCYNDMYSTPIGLSQWYEN